MGRSNERLIAQWGERIKQRVAAGRSMEALARQMTKAGLSTREIKAAFADAADRARYARKKRDIHGGTLWLIGGVLVTIGTYSAGVESGAVYVVSWGVIGIGLARLLRGYATSTRFDPRSDVDDDDWYDDKDADTDEDDEPTSRKKAAPADEDDSDDGDDEDEDDGDDERASR